MELASPPGAGRRVRLGTGRIERSCFAWGLPERASPRRSVSSYLTIFTLTGSPGHSVRCGVVATTLMWQAPFGSMLLAASNGMAWRRVPAVCFCGTFLRVAPTGRYPARCPGKPGLSSRRPDARSPDVLDTSARGLPARRHRSWRSREVGNPIADARIARDARRMLTNGDDLAKRPKPTRGARASSTGSFPRGGSVHRREERWAWRYRRSPRSRAGEAGSDGCRPVARHASNADRKYGSASGGASVARYRM